MSKKVLAVLIFSAILFVVSGWNSVCLLSAKFLGVTSSVSYSSNWLWLLVAVVSGILLFGTPEFLEYLEKKKKVSR